MKRNRLFQILAFTLICFSTTSYSQRLNIGDKFENVSVANVLNYKSDQLNFADFKGKLIILDFWSTTCSSCLRKLPEIDSLQELFKEKLQFICVSRQKKDIISKFFEIRKKLRMPTAVPFITGDSLLAKLFPYGSVPFHVWIDEASKVRFMTGGSDTDFEHLKKYFANELNHLEPYVPGRDYVENMIASEFDEALEYYSAITRCLNNEISLVPQNEKFESITYTCTSIIKLYQDAYNGETKIAWDGFRRPGRTILEVKDSIKYISLEGKAEIKKNWREKYSYNYQLLIPKEKKASKYEIMKQDLSRYFNLEASIEKRLVKCLVLVRTSDIDKLKTKGGPRKDNFIQTDIYLRSGVNENDTIKLIQNRSFEIFYQRMMGLIEINLSIPLIDSTSYVGNIDIEMKPEAIDSLDITKLRAGLRKYDLDIIEKECLLPVLVISEKNQFIAR